MHSGKFSQTSIAMPETARGFTLIEVLVAFLILAIGLLGTAYVQTRSVQFNYQSQIRNHIDATVFEMIERMRTLGISTDSDDPVLNANIYTAQISDNAVQTANCPDSGVPAANETLCFMLILTRRVPFSNMRIETLDLDSTNVGPDHYQITVYWSDQQLLSQGDEQVLQPDCQGLGKIWSGQLTWWPGAGIPDPGLCLVSHSWQFAVEAL